jgi:putative membrane protein
MIPNFSDHAANERTFLAWIRTAIAIMAFGFLVARFNLFLQIAAQSLKGAASDGLAATDRLGNLAGLLLIVAGTVIVIGAAVRFVRTGRAIDSPTRHSGGARADLLLAGLIALLGICMVLYLSETLLAGL